MTRIRRILLAGPLCLLLLAPVLSSDIQAQLVRGDSLSVVEASSHSPQGALRRSALLPGWGQIYNRQYIKLPFIYGALGGLIYAAKTSHDDYVLYREAFQYKSWQEQVESGQAESNPKTSFKDSYEVISAKFGAVSSRPLESQRNNFRRSRDLSLIGIGLVYGLAMLDAYVSAHLLDFDVGENLSFRADPQAGGFRLSARIHLGTPDGRSLPYR